MSQRVLREAELGEFGVEQGWASRLQALLRHQISNWPACRAGFLGLEDVCRKEVWVDGDRVWVQYNPLRICSVAADVSPEGIKSRPCFLCEENLPELQAGLLLPGDYIALCNPQPIFEAHFTIAHLRHIRQDISRVIKPYLEIARLLGPEYALFFNGAKAGASAPDHLHYQACPASALPVLGVVGDEYRILKLGGDEMLQVHMVIFAGVRYLVVRGASVEAVGRKVEKFLEILASKGSDGKDLVNIITRHTGVWWEVVLVGRSKHRPDCYFRNEGERFLISPACVELGGVVVAPRREDFERLNGMVLLEIFQEVTLSRPFFEEVARKVVSA